MPYLDKLVYLILECRTLIYIVVVITVELAILGHIHVGWIIALPWYWYKVCLHRLLKNLGP